MKRVMLLLITSLLSPNTFATETKKTTCDDLILACDKALEAKQKQVEATNIVLANVLREKQEAEAALEDKTNSLARYCRNPIITGSAGMASGALAVVTGPLALVIGGGVIVLSCLF